MRNLLPRTLHWIFYLAICVTLIYAARYMAYFIRSAKPSNEYFSSEQLKQLSLLFGLRQYFTRNVSSNGSSKCLSFDIKLGEVTRGPFGIPKIIHQIYMSTDLPLQYMDFLTKCRKLNKDFVHILWTDDDFMLFLQKRRPEWIPTLKK